MAYQNLSLKFLLGDVLSAGPVLYQYTSGVLCSFFTMNTSTDMFRIFFGDADMYHYVSALPPFKTH